MTRQPTATIDTTTPPPYLTTPWARHLPRRRYLLPALYPRLKMMPTSRGAHCIHQQPPTPAVRDKRMSQLQRTRFFLPLLPTLNIFDDAPVVNYGPDDTNNGANTFANAPTSTRVRFCDLGAVQVDDSGVTNPSANSQFPSKQLAPSSCTPPRRIATMV